MQPSDKFKFNFDWDAAEDTSKDLNPLYNNTHGAQRGGGGEEERILLKCPPTSEPYYRIGGG